MALALSTKITLLASWASYLGELSSLSPSGTVAAEEMGAGHERYMWKQTRKHLP